MNIYIYGAGAYARHCYADLILLGLSVKGFVVTDRKENPGNLLNVPVVALESLSLGKEDFLIVAMRPSYQRDVSVLLRYKGIQNFALYPNAEGMDLKSLVKLGDISCKCRQFRHVYIYGAGAYGRICFDFLNGRGIKIDGIVVTEIKEGKKDLDGVPVVSYRNLSTAPEETLVVVALKPEYREQVHPLLKDAGFMNCMDFRDEPFLPPAPNHSPVPTSPLEAAWARRHDFTIEPEAFGCMSEVHEKQRQREFPLNIKFSILVPLYNTPMLLLKEMIASVLLQSYQNWELCLADASDQDHRYVRAICEEISRTEPRIRYRKLAENNGIAENTNACVEMAEGDYMALLDHDDLLHPAALYEAMKVISADGADFIYTDEAVFKSPNLYEILGTNFKPDFAPDYLNGLNYITHLTVFSKKLYEHAGCRFDPLCDGAQDYDIILKLTEKASCIRHIPKCLYYWRAVEGSTAMNPDSKNYTSIAGQRAVQGHFARCGISATVSLGHLENSYRVKYEIHGSPLVSIIIPSCDHWQTLKKCVESILNLSTYSNIEILVVENNSKDIATFAYYKELENTPKVRILYRLGKFNYSAVNNQAAGQASGEHLLFLNNDIEVISSNWIEEMLMYAQREDVGAVGAMLYYPGDRIQHAGVVVGLGGFAGHVYGGVPRNGSQGYARRLMVPQDYSAVTGACVMVPKKVFDTIGGFDETFALACNDVDLCMKIRKAGLYVVWTPFAELYHHESESRGYEDTPEKMNRFEGEKYWFREKWAAELASGDPFYNRNLTLQAGDFGLAEGNTVFHN